MTLFGKKKREARTCEAGHELEASWERCPHCEAERAKERGARDGDAAPPAAEAPPAPVPPPAEFTADPAAGAVVVPKPGNGRRPLAGWLVALVGEQVGRDFRLEVGRNVIGKGAGCDVVLKDSRVSERHAVLECRSDGRILLEDLDSRHGTVVDGAPVGAARAIEDGAVIRVGHTELKLRTFA